MTVLADLLVRLNADSSALKQEMVRTNQSLQKFEDGIKKIGKGIGLVLGAAGVGLAAIFSSRALRSSIDMAAALKDTADAAGITTDKLQELQFAGNELGLESGDIATSMTYLNTRLGEFANTGKGPAATALRQLSINLRDSKGNVRDTGDVFNELVNKISQVENPMQRAALASKLFGETLGPKMGQLIAQGTEGLANYAQQARDIGAVLDADIIASAHDADVALTKLSNVLKVQLTSALVSLAPLLTEAANGFIELARWATATFGQIENLSRQGAETRLADKLQYIADLEKQLARSTSAEGSNALVDYIYDAFNLDPAEIQGKIDEAESDIKQLYSRISAITVREAENAASAIKFKFDPVGADQSDNARKAAEKAAAKEQAANMRELTALYEQVRNPADAFGVTIVNLNKLLEQGKISWDIYAEAVFKAQDALEEASKSTEEKEVTKKEEERLKRIASLYEQVRNPADLFGQTIVDLNDLLDKGKISWDTYSEAVFNAQEVLDAYGKTSQDTGKELKKINEFAEEMGLTFSSAFEKAITDGEKFSEVLKGILKDIIAIIARKTVTEPLGDLVSGGIKKIFGFASGTQFTPGGPILVGEEGPEIIMPPAGSAVIPNDRVSLSGGGVTLNIDARNSTDPMATERAVRRAVHESIAHMRALKVRGGLPEFA